jgi:hypothetical protein
MLHYYFINGDCFGWIPKWHDYIRFVSFEEYLEVLKANS